MFSDSLPEELTQARQLINEAKLSEARELITNFEMSGEITPEVQLSVLLLKGRIDLFEFQYNKAIQTGDQAYQMSKELGDIHGVIEALHLKARGVFIGNFEECLELISESETLMTSIQEEILSSYFQQQFKLSLLLLKSYVSLVRNETQNLFDFASQCLTLSRNFSTYPFYIYHSSILLAWAYVLKGDPSTALNYALDSLELSKKLNLNVLTAHNLSQIGQINYYKRDLDTALTYCKQSLSTDGIEDFDKTQNYVLLGNIFREKGDLDKALKYFQRGINLAEDIGFGNYVSRGIMYIGSIHRVMGHFDQAIDYLNRSLTLSKKQENSYTTYYSLLPLIFISLDKESIEQAQDYFSQLKDLVDRMKSAPFNLGFKLTKAMILKKQGRTKNRAEAEELLKQVVEEAKNAILDPWVHIMALTAYCEHLIEELIAYGDPEILNEINPLITQLLAISENQRSYSYLAEAKVLQSKLLLIQKDIDGSKKVMIEAQRIAELHGLTLLAQKISHEHDKLLEQSDIWGDVIEKNVSLPERIRLASFDGVIDRLQGKRAVDPPEMVDEQPTLLLIIAEGGVLIFSLPFTKEWKRDDALFSSFLSAFSSFSNEFFTKGLDRAKFGDDSILMRSIGPFSICYLFKGQTYPATQNLTRFTEQIQNTTTIWQNLEKYYRASQVLELKDNSPLESLITEIFINKNEIN
ncbi:MAG: tetratricopeptide repeat protein [Promethearchaeota archaeon]|jgi:tetratricopeptide (TPR) repeat protein